MSNVIVDIGLVLSDQPDKDIPNTLPRRPNLERAKVVVMEERYDDRRPGLLEARGLVKGDE